MEFKKLFNKMSHLFFKEDIDQEQLHAGTGFMLCLSDMIRDCEKQGYTANLVAEYDHFRVDQIKIYPDDFFVDEIQRFENSSDPDDQAILYSISSRRYGLKGLYVESYGLYHDSLSPAMLERIKFCQKSTKDVLPLAPIDADITI